MMDLMVDCVNIDCPRNCNGNTGTLVMLPFRLGSFWGRLGFQEGIGVLVGGARQRGLG